MGMRLTVAEQVSRKLAFRGRPLAIEVRGPKGFGTRATEALNNLPALLAAKGVEVKFYTPLGHELNAAALIGKTPADIDAMAAQIDAPSQVATSRKPQTIFPQTLEVVGQTYKRVMTGELTGIEAAQFLKPEEVSGHNADELQSRLRNPSGEALVYTNEDDAKAYIQSANRQGRKVRFMIAAEFDALPAEVKSQLKGVNWFLVETSCGSGQYYWRSLDDARLSSSVPGGRYYDDAVRLVED